MTPVLALAFILAHFLRSAPAVIAPNLRTELGLTPGELSSLPAAIFLGAALMQLPVGVFLDRYGPRRTMAALFSLAALGAIVFASAHGVTVLAAGLFLIGCGAAPVLGTRPRFRGDLRCAACRSRALIAARHTTPPAAIR